MDKIRVGLVLFNDIVHLIGDGLHDKDNLVISDNGTLNDYDRIISFIDNLKSYLISLPILTSRGHLIEIIDNLQPDFATTLGPALLSSVVLASEGKPGSIVYLCTDGTANNGVGKMPEEEGGGNYIAYDDFYERVGQLAQSKGVIVNLLTFKEARSNIFLLSRACELSCGGIDIID